MEGGGVKIGLGSAARLGSGDSGCRPGADPKCANVGFSDRIRTSIFRTLTVPVPSQITKVSDH